ncbi:MAG: flagellar protein FlaG [Gammaproteobacteria bacterium]|nr:MAG: flagellar protein FlaG [Gammaproteobacteria bacterium]
MPSITTQRVPELAAMPVPSGGKAREGATDSGNASARVEAAGKTLPTHVQAVEAGRQEVATLPREQAETLVRRVQEEAASLRRRLEFMVDTERHEVVIKVRDAETGRLIRQIPPQDVMDLADRLSETVGVLFRSVV